MSSRPGSRRTRRALSVSVLASVLGTGLAVPLALAGPAAAAEPAATASVNEYGWHLTYTAAAGQANKVAIEQSYNDDRSQFTFVIDDSVPVETGDGCEHPDASDKTRISCTVEAPESQSPLESLEMDLGDGDDSATFDNATDQVYYFNTVRLGDGKDKWNSDHGGKDDGASVHGGAGDDVLAIGAYGSAAGDDGDDTVSTTDGGEFLSGGAGDDVLRGGKGGQIMHADDGADKLYGADGDDEMYGGKGNDLMYGNAGADRMWGNSGDDKLYGGAGRDTLSGGPGSNVVVQD
ncbi:calcium-binding protein [Streptomyces sp. NPDC048172]|uniref:calcium-binding protein n=1 Tax=Streptomyces sp. NPDC048172 TaxID=3365505 RepID=UPI0037137EB2